MCFSMAPNKTSFNETFAAAGDCCADLFCRRSSNTERRSLLHEDYNYKMRTWCASTKRAFKKFLQLLTVPKCRPLIRHFNSHHPSKKTSQFQYDPVSYALNFDGGSFNHRDEATFHSFSARFASPISRTTVLLLNH